MRVKNLIKLLLDLPMDADVIVVNKNDNQDEFMNPGSVGKLVTDAIQLDDGSCCIYYAGDVPADEVDADEL
jgi:hypothetical protein